MFWIGPIDAWARGSPLDRRRRPPHRGGRVRSAGPVLHHRPSLLAGRALKKESSHPAGSALARACLRTRPCNPPCSPATGLPLASRCTGYIGQRLVADQLHRVAGRRRALPDSVGAACKGRHTRHGRHPLFDHASIPDGNLRRRRQPPQREPAPAARSRPQPGRRAAWDDQVAAGVGLQAVQQIDQRRASRCAEALPSAGPQTAPVAPASCAAGPGLRRSRSAPDCGGRPDGAGSAPAHARSGL